MASNVDICNQALMYLGDMRITALTEDTTAAKICNTKFITVRDAVLRAYPWNFAIKRATLARSTTTPTWGYDYQYALPTSPYCLRVLNMKEHDEYGEDWKIEGRYLLTDSTTCNIKYIAQITDSNEMDVLFREAFSAKLAAEICFSLTGDKNRADAAKEVYRIKLKEAKSTDAQEGNPDSLIDDTFMDSRL